MNNKQVFINLDWKEMLSLEKLKQLETFGIFVYEDPNFEGSDSIGFIFSNKKLTKEEVNQLSNEEHE